MRRLLRWLLHAIAGLTALCLLAAGALLAALHTDWGREKVRAIAEAQLDELVEGDVELGRITGSVLTRFEIHGIVVRDRLGRVAVRARKLLVDYDLLALLERRVRVEELQLIEPIVIGRLDDLAGLWKRQPVDPRASATRAEPWAIQLGVVRVQDGLLAVSTAGATWSLAHLELDAGVDVAATTRRFEVARLAAIWLERGVRVEAHGSVVESEQLIALAGVEVVAGASRLAVPLGMVRPPDGFVAAVAASVRESDLFLFWPHAVRLGDASLHGLLVRADEVAPIEARLVIKALGGEVALAAAARPESSAVRGELHVRGMSSPLPELPAKLDLDARLDLAGRSLDTARGSLELSARGAIMGREIDSLKVAATLRDRLAGVEVTVAVPAARATAQAKLRLGERGDLTIEAARLRAQVSDLGRVVGRPDLDGDVDLDVSARGTLRVLAIAGTARAARLRAATARAAHVSAIFDLTGVPGDPRGFVNLDAQQVVAGATPLGRIHARAHLPGGRLADVAVAVMGPKLPYTGRAAARVALLEDGVQVTFRRIEALARGLELRGDGGVVTVARDGRVTARDVALASRAGRVEIEGEMMPSPARGRGEARTIQEPRSSGRRSAAHPCVARRLQPERMRPPRSFGCLQLDGHTRSALELSGLALPQGKMHLHAHDLDLAMLRAAFAPELRPIAGRVAADLHVLRDGRQLGFAGEVMASGITGLDARLPPVDVSTSFNAGHGLLFASGHARVSPPARAMGVVDFALSSQVPVDLTDTAAWQRIDLDEALAGAIVTLRDVDLAALGELLERDDLSGRFDATLIAAPGARAVEVAATLRGLTVAPVRGLDARLDGRWDREALTVAVAVSAGGAEVLTAKGQLRAGLKALVQGAELFQLPLDATLVAQQVPVERLRGVLPGLGRRAYGKLSIDAALHGTLERPTGTFVARLDDARVARIEFHDLETRARLDREVIEASVIANQKGGGKLDASVRVDRLAGNDLEVRLRASRFDIGFLAAMSRRRTDALAGAGGKLDADVSLTTHAGQRTTSGTLALHEGQVYTPGGVSGLVHGVEIEARLAGGRVTVAKLTGQSESGSFHGSADVVLSEALLPRAFTARIAATRFPVSAGAMVVALSVDADLSGKAMEDAWEIDATLRGTRIRVPEERRTGAKVQPVGELADLVYTDLPDFQRRTAFLALTGSPEIEEGGGPTVRLRLKTPGGVRVSGRELDLLLATNLTVLYRAGNPYVGGAVEANRGFIELFNRRYDVLRANASFDENEPIDPHLDIRLSHEFRATTVTIHVGGTQARPTLDLSADPGHYDQAQLLGWVLGGDPDDPAVGKRPIGTEAVGLASSMVLDQMQNLVKLALPVDVLSVKMGEGSDAQTTRFEVGKWVSESLFVGYTYRLNAPDDKNLNEVEVEYRIGARWLLDAFFGDRGVAGADMIWSRKY